MRTTQRGGDTIRSGEVAAVLPVRRGMTTPGASAVITASLADMQRASFPNLRVAAAIEEASKQGGINTELLAATLSAYQNAAKIEGAKSKGATTADVAGELLKDFLDKLPGFDEAKLIAAVNSASLTVESAHNGYLQKHGLPAHLSPEQAAQRVRIDSQILASKDRSLDSIRTQLADHRQGKEMSREPREVYQLKDLELGDFTNYRQNFFHNLKMGAGIFALAVPTFFLMALEARILGRMFLPSVGILAGAAAYFIKQGVIPWFKPSVEPDPESLNSPLFNETNNEIRAIGFIPRHRLLQQKDGRWSLTVYACLPASEGI